MNDTHTFICSSLLLWYDELPYHLTRCFGTIKVPSFIFLMSFTPPFLCYLTRWIGPCFLLTTYYHDYTPIRVFTT